MFGVTRTTTLRVVPWCLKLLATTTAPMQYESMVARVTKASLAWQCSKDRIRWIWKKIFPMFEAINKPFGKILSPKVSLDTWKTIDVWSNALPPLMIQVSSQLRRLQGSLAQPINSAEEQCFCLHSCISTTLLVLVNNTSLLVLVSTSFWGAKRMRELFENIVS